MPFPRLSAYGMTADDIPLLVEKSAVASSMKGNPVLLSDEELSSILSSSLDRTINGASTLTL